MELTYLDKKAPAPTPTPAPTPAGAGVDPATFSGMLSQVGENLKFNNGLASNRQMILKHLYDSPLTPDELKQLPPDIQNVVNSGDKDALELQVRVLNDQLQGRAQTLGTTIQALTTGYQNAETNTKNAVSQILAYAQSTGGKISDVAKALAPIYGVNITDQMIKNLEKLGAPLLKTTQVANSPSVYGTATSTISNMLGVVPTTSLSSVIESNGMDSIIDAIIKNEGSSPKGVMNNPGNIKYSGLPGQLDSGIKASDGGTFASYSTPEDGRHAIEYIVHNAADSQSSAYGMNPTLGDFIDKYTNTAPDTSVNALPPEPTDANKPGLGGFTPNAIYQDALEMAFTGKSVQSFVGGLSNSGDAKSIKAAITNKAAALASATGTSFPAMQALYKANASAAKQSVERLARVESVNSALTLNVPRIQELATKLAAGNITITESDIQAGKASALRKFGSQDAAAYIELIQTIRSDYASAQAALAGSRGSQFFAENAQDAIPVGLTADQYGTIQQTIQLSSDNAKKAINGEVQDLIGTSGSISTPTGNSNSSGDDYQAYLKSIGQQ